MKDLGDKENEQKKTTTKQNQLHRRIKRFNCVFFSFFLDMCVKNVVDVLVQQMKQTNKTKSKCRKIKMCEEKINKIE